MEIEFAMPTGKASLLTELGVEKGFFGDECIDLNVRVGFGGPPLAAAFNSGEVQIREIGSPPGVVALRRATMKHAALREMSHLNLNGRLNFKGLGETIVLQKSLGAIKRPLVARDMAAENIVEHSTEVADT